jgi:uncharacterized protein (TIGR00369 family)
MSGVVAEGFEEMPTGLGYADTLRPLYWRAGELPAMGMFVQASHINLLGICHGGVLMTLADMAAARGIRQAREGVGGAPTLNLSFDFIAAAQLGDWLQAEVDRVTVKRRLAFCSGVVVSGEKLICRFSGGFYLFDQ